MTTIFKSLCASCGMTVEEAAVYLNIRYDTALALYIGKHAAPSGIIIEMKECFEDINSEAHKLLSLGQVMSEDQAVQRRIIEIMHVDGVLANFRQN